MNKKKTPDKPTLRYPTTTDLQYLARRVRPLGDVNLLFCVASNAACHISRMMTPQDASHVCDLDESWQQLHVREIATRKWPG